MDRASFTSWGGLRVTPARSVSPIDARALRPPPGRWLAYGNGRSYGDSCLAGAGTMMDMRGLGRILAFDAHSDTLHAEAGTLLGEIIRHVRGSGWFPPVVPGTQHVTLAGAIANDIHGKNHHRRGTFGAHVRSLTLLRSTGERMKCSLTSNNALFRATIGGMGLTGIILDAEISLMPAASHDIVQQAFPLRNLADFFRIAPACETKFEYAVAWLDSLATGSDLGRGALLCGNHAPTGPDTAMAAKAWLHVPFTPPFSLVNQPGLRLFNALYRRSALRTVKSRRVSCRGFFFPLDALDDWNRLYGPKGLRQHQCVLPLAGAETIVRRLLETAQAAGHGSLLTVIKLFGPSASPGMLSFPREGVTLTLDFANHGATTAALLAALDHMVLDAGGRVNPYKDARMTADVFAASFPDTAAFRAQVDPAAISDFAVRVGLARPDHAGSSA